MADDAARSSLFGGAAVRNTGKANPYAPASGGADASSGGNPFAAAQSPANSAPSNSPFVGFEDPAASSSGAASRSPAGALSPDDAARASLLAGGRRREPSGSVVSPPPSAAVNQFSGGGGSSGPTASSLPASARSATDGALFADAVPEDDGAVEFDLDNLNLMASASGDGEEGGGAGSLADALNFAVIDEDLARFAQDEVIREALSRGVDLRLYSRTVDAELRHMEMLSIGDYVAQADAVAALFEQISHCEGVLGAMQGMLSSFQDNLGGISAEIRSLQEQSLSLSVQMNNRRALGRKLDVFLSKVSVPEALILRIVEGAVDEAWMRDLGALAEKLHYVQRGVAGGFTTPAAAAAPPSSAGAGSPGSPDAGAAAAASAAETLSDLSVNPFSTPVGRESLPQVEKLRVTAVGKLRGFLSKALGELTRPQSNMAKTQEYMLLRYAPGMTFLSEFGGEAGREVRGMYCEAVGRQYADIFKRYHEDLVKGAGAPGPLKADTLVEYNAQARLAAAVSADSSLAPLAAAQGVRLLVDPFELGTRAAILPEADAPPTPAHVAVSEAAGPSGRRLPYEAIWRTLVRHLMDVACSEFSFSAQFFGQRFARELFSLTMTRSLSVLLSALEEHLLTTGDAPGLLLLVALTAAHRRIMETDRRCSELGGFFDRVTMLLWPRVKLILDANVASLKAAREGTSAAARKLAPSSGDLGPHPVMRRYAEFASSFLVLHRQLAAVHLSDEMLPMHLAAMGREADGLLQRMAEALPSRVAKLVFLTSNYSACIAVAAQRGVAAEDAAPWQRSAGQYGDLYCEAELEQHFKGLQGFVRKAEAAAAAAAAAVGVALPPPAAGLPAGQPPSILVVPDSVPVSVDGTEVAAVLRDFNVNWRTGVRSLHDDAMRYFGPPPAAAGTPAGIAAANLAAALLRRVMTAFVSLYERFSTLLGRALPPSSATLREVVSLQTIYFELRKYSRGGASDGGAGSASAAAAAAAGAGGGGFGF